MAEEMFERKYRRYLGETLTAEGRCRVESEAVLPDYKEAALRILRVDGKARINSKNLYLQGRELICEVEGVETFHILYLSEDKKDGSVPCSFMTQENFSYRFKLAATEEMDVEEMAALIEVKSENTSSKLLGPRKISMRSDVALLLSVRTNRSLAYYGDGLPEDVQRLEKKMTAVSLAAVCQEELRFSETISLPKNYLPIGEICEMDVELFCHKVQVSDGGIRLSGSCDVQCSYVSEGEENFISFYQPIEFERNIGLAQCEKDHVAEWILTPNFLKAATDVNEDGENKNILFEIGCSLEIRLYRNDTFSVIEDAFSTENHLEIDKETVSCEELVASLDFASPVRASLPSGEEKILRAEGIRHGTEFKNAYFKDGSIVVEGKTSFRYLGVKENGEVIHLETAHDFQAQIPVEAGILPDKTEDLRIELCGGARGVDLDPANDRLEARYELCGHIMIFCKHRLLAVTSLAGGENKQKSEKCLLFYYPEKGETLWDVCKKYSVSPDALREENGLDGDLLPDMICVRI